MRPKSRRLTEVKGGPGQDAFMTQRIVSPDRHSITPIGAWIAVGSTLLLTGLALADRMSAWLIGVFPSSAMVWQLRFEYLRPIGVFHDIAVANLGQISAPWFGVVTVLCGLAVTLCAVSSVRVARALAYHVLLGTALALTVFSLGPSAGIYSNVGAPSAMYVVIGLLLSASTAMLCVFAHAEYMGWTPRYALLQRRLTTRVARRVSGLWQRFLPAAGLFQAAPVRVRIERRSAASN
jgi:hypothetical protein